MGRRLRRQLFVLVVAVACLSVALIGVTRSTAVSSEHVALQAAFGSLPDYLDPQLSYTSEGWTAMYNTYIPLLTFRHGNGRAGADIVPGLATGLPKITNGGRTYTLFLRHGLKYSDGTSVRASDFEFAIKRLLELNSSGSPFYTLIAGGQRFQRAGRGGISGITSDNRTGKIVVHLIWPYGAFADLLALPFAAPVPASTPMRSQTFSPPPATGPFAITEVSYRGWSYARNPAWESTNGRLLPGLPGGYVDGIEVRVESPERQLDQVMAGSLDWMQGPVPPARYVELRRKYGGSQFRAEPTLTTFYFWMNTTKAPFDDLRVRRAANYAIDPAVMRRIYGGQLAPSQQILPPGMPGYRKFVLYPHSLARARRLVAAADPSDRDVTVWTDTESVNREAAAYYRSRLERIGLHAHLKAVAGLDYFTAIGSSSTPDLDTGWANWYADYSHPDDFFRPTMLGSGVARTNNTNLARIDVPALNSKIEALGQGGPLGPARERRYAALDRAYMKRAPWVPIGNPTASMIVSKAIDLDRVIWNPLIGADLSSFQFK
jgi:peptide/nickel transport system substrate-binding protein